MATSVTQSLFGITPESIMQERSAAANRQAMDFARLDPFEAARYGLFRGASQLGDVAASAMGYEDPEIARAKARQGMLSGVDLNNPESLLAKAQSLQATDPMAAQALVAQANERQVTLTAQQEADAKKAEEKRRLASLATVVQQKTGLGPEESLALAKDPVAVRELMKDETAITETKEGVFLVSKKTGNRIARIGDTVEKGTRVNVSPTIKMGGDAVGLMKGIADLTKPEQEMLKSAQTTKTLINEAAASNNSQTWEAARTQVAKAVGEGKLSNEDIRRTGVDPRLVQGALDWVNKKTVGVPNQDIMKQLYVVATLLEKQAVNRINSTMTQARTLATDVSGVSPTAAETIFPMVGDGGSGGAVNWSDMK